MSITVIDGMPPSADRGWQHWGLHLNRETRYFGGMGIRGFLTVTASVLFLAACGGSSSPEPEPASLEEEYLADVYAVEADAFVSDKAALLYLKNYCEAKLSSTVATPDAVDQVVAQYCDTPLADEVGVKTPRPMPEPEGIDEETFRQEALDRFEIGVEEADGSKMDAVATARMICDGDTAAMLERLGSDFAGSFQEFAMTAYCPEKLP